MVTLRPRPHHYLESDVGLRAVLLHQYTKDKRTYDIDTHGLRNVCCVTQSQSWVATEQSYWYALATSLDRDRSCIQVGRRPIAVNVDYKNYTLSELYAMTMTSNSSSHLQKTQIISQPTSNLHASLWNIPKQEMTDCHVTLWVWAEHTRGLGLGGKVLALVLALALTSPRPRPRLFSRGQGQDLVIQGQGQGQDLYEVSSRILEHVYFIDITKSN